MIAVQSRGRLSGLLLLLAVPIAGCAHSGAERMEMAGTGGGTSPSAGSIDVGAVTCPQAPKAIGPYSQAVAVDADRLLFLSGQIPIDPATGAKVNETSGRDFPQARPARATVQVAALPKGARVEIAAVATAGSTSRVSVSSPSAEALER